MNGLEYVESIIDEVPEGAWPAPLKSDFDHVVEGQPAVAQSERNMWEKIYELASVPSNGPNNREERRRVEKVLRKLAKRGLTIG